MGRSPVPLLTFLDICSLLDLGGWLLGGDLGQERGEAEEQVGPPELHVAALAGAAAAACFGLGQRAVAAAARPARLMAAATGTSVQETLPDVGAGVPKKKKKEKEKKAAKEEGLGEPRCPGNTHPVSWPCLLKQNDCVLEF